MIQVPRRAAERFRAAVRRCVNGRPRGFAPSIVLTQTPKLLTMSAALGEVVLWLRLPVAATADERIVLSFAMLETVARADGEMVNVEVLKQEVHVAWTTGDEERRTSGEIGNDPGESASMPAVRMRPLDAAFRTALHECGKSASRESVRFALSKILVRGKEGMVVGSDGGQLLMWSGFDLPFREELLIPAIPFFGTNDFGTSPSLRVGRSASHVLVGVGDWTVGLAIDVSGRYPKIASVLPKQPGPARLVITDLDVPQVVKVLESRPVGADEQTAVVIDLGNRSAIIIPGESSAADLRCDFSGSKFAGIATRTAIDRRHLLRALSLGLREVHADTTANTLLFRDDRRSFLVACPTVPALSEPADSSPTKTSRSPTGDESSHSPEGERPMAAEKSNGAVAPESVTEDDLDPLAEAESLREAIVEVGRRTARLIASLRQLRRHRKALRNAWTSLRQLRLGAKEET